MKHIGLLPLDTCTLVAWKGHMWNILKKNIIFFIFVLKKKAILYSPVCLQTQ